MKKVAYSCVVLTRHYLTILQEQWQETANVITISPVDKVTDVVSPAPDGNCGFRCLVHVLKKGSGGQGAFAEIKDEMLACLQAKKAWYLQSKVYLPDQVDRLEFILKEKRTFVDERYWFSVPDCAQLASDTFNIPIKVFSFDDAQGNILFFPT